MRYKGIFLFYSLFCIALLPYFSKAQTCEAPTNLQVSTSPLPTGILATTFTWEAFELADKYSVHIRNIGTGSVDMNSNITGTSFTKEGLEPETNYEFRVVSVCGGTIAQPAWQPFTTPSGLTCEAPTNLQVSASPLPTGILATTFTWEAFELADKYSVHIRNIGTGSVDMNSNITGTSFTKEGLEPETNYEFRVVSVCGGTIAQPAWQPFTTPSGLTCEAPTNLQVSTSPLPTGILATTFTWEAFELADKYSVHIRNIGTGSVDMNSNITGTSFTKEGLEPETNYEFRVVSVCGGTIAQPAWQPFTTPSGLTCEAPTNLQVSASPLPTGILATTFTWEAFELADKYSVHIRNIGTGSVDMNSNITGTSFTKEGLEPETNYEFRVVSVCGGTIAQPAWQPFTTPSGLTCEAPTNLQVSTSPLTTGILATTFTWEAFELADKYNLTIRNITTGERINKSNLTTTSIVQESLLPETKYEFRVVSVCGASSAISIWKAFTTPEGLTCDPPNNLAATTTQLSTGILSTTFTWESFELADKYRLIIKHGETGSEHGVNNLELTSYTVEGLDPETNYQFRVVSYCGGTSAISEWQTFTTPAGLTCEGPTNLQVSTTQLPTGILATTFSWEAFTLADKYSLQIRHGETGSIQGISNITGTSHVREGLDPETDYEYRVASICGGTSMYTEWQTFTTPAGLTCEGPTNLQVSTTQLPTGILATTFSWEAFTLADKYSLQIRHGETGSIQGISNITGTSHVREGLDPETDYEYRVASICGGTSMYTEWQAFTTPAGLTCEGPTNLQVSTTQLPTGILATTFSWEAFTLADKYSLQIRHGETGSIQGISNITGTSHVREGLDPETDYEYRVASICGGTSMYTEWQTFTTPAGLTCEGPTNLQVSTTQLPTGILATTFSWEAFTLADKYSLQIRHGETGSIQGISNITGTSHVREGLDPETDYEYRVASICGGTSMYTEWQTFTTPAGLTCEGPTNLQVSTTQLPTGILATTFSWEAFTLADKYSLQIRHGETGSIQGISNITGTSHVREGLDPETDYEYRVASICGGTSMYTEWQTFTTPAGLTCEGPTNLQVSTTQLPTGILATTFSWEAFTLADKYSLQIRHGEKGSIQGISNITGTSHVREGLDPETNYEYRVASICGGTSMYTEWQTFTTPAGLTCEGPTNLQVSTTQLPTGILATTFSWEAFTLADKYSLQIRHGETGSIQGISNITGTSHVREGLDPETDYEYRVASICGGTSMYTEWQTFTTPAGLTCEGPTNLQVSTTQLPTGILATTFSWEAFTLADKYSLQIRHGEKGSIQGISNITGTSHVREGLDPETNYEYRVASICGGTSMYTEWQTFTTPAGRTCDAPINLQVTTTETPSGILSTTFSWEVFDLAETYTVQYRNIAVGSIQTRANIGSTSYVQEGLEPDAEYEFRVASICGGASDYTEWTKFSTMVEYTVLYAIASGNWNDPAIWSYTQNGPTLGRIPASTDDVVIDGFIIEITEDHECGSVTLSNTNGTTALQITNGLLSVTEQVLLNKKDNNAFQCEFSVSGSVSVQIAEGAP
jgi:hypothetical protein